MIRIYLDNAAATPLDPAVKREIFVCEDKIFGNASSLHKSGLSAKNLIDKSRNLVAKVLNAGTDEIIFTGSGTEANNLATLGIARALKKYGKHIVTTSIEHHSVLNACKKLSKEGFKITYVGVDKNGIVNPDDIKKAVRKDTVLVSVAYANNEIGTIQPIQQIAKAIRNFRKNNKPGANEKLPVFHSDACQAAGYMDLNVQKLGIDLLSLNGTKIYGPKGVGCLFVKRGINIEPIMFGGSQERGLRPGTESPPLIVGFAKALELADKNREKESGRLVKLRDYAVSKMLAEIPGSSLNGDAKERLPNNINISFEDVDGEMLVFALDKKGIEVSTGAACTTSETGPSHVLKAIGKKSGDNLRVTLGRFNAKKDVDYLIKVLPAVVAKLRKVY